MRSSRADRPVVGLLRATLKYGPDARVEQSDPAITLPEPARRGVRVRRSVRRVSDSLPTPATRLTPAEMWRAFLRRDVRYDGRFVTAVRTTGVFCRPTCTC